MVFFTCVLKISNHFINFSLRNGQLNIKHNTLSRRKFFVFLSFIGEDNERIKKIYQEDTCG